MTLRKAIFPIAGLGTRFLPATKAVPKEMLPVVDKPLIQYAVEEARAAGIEEFIFVVRPGNRSIEAHFSHSSELEDTLRRRGRKAELRAVTSLCIDRAKARYVQQDQPLGLGHAVLCARAFADDEPLAILLPDDLIQATTPCLAQMADAYGRCGGNMIAVMDVPKVDAPRYGMVEPGHRDGRLFEVKGLVEKPAPEAAPSTLAVVGRYIVQPGIFRHLSRQRLGAGGEIQLTDALAAMIGETPCHGFLFEGRRFDCGAKSGFLEANLAYALNDPEIGGEARRAVLRLAAGEALPSAGGR